MTDWATLETAYGSAAGVPEMLRRAERTRTDLGEVWDELWSHLCHQGTVYTGSYAAIPELTAICLRQRPRGYMASLHLVGAIIASTDGPEDPAEVRARYSSELAQLAELAEGCLPMAGSDNEFLYGLEIWMSLELGGVWSRSLSCLADGEAPIDCPSCHRLLLLRVEGLPATLTPWDGSGKPTAVDPVPEPGEPDEARLLQLALVNSRPTIAGKLRYAFGSGACPACRNRLVISHAFA